jgi:hypothetical protein
MWLWLWNPKHKLVELGIKMMLKVMLGVRSWDFFFDFFKIVFACFHKCYDTLTAKYSKVYKCAKFSSYHLEITAVECLVYATYWVFFQFKYALNVCVCVWVCVWGCVYIDVHILFCWSGVWTQGFMLARPELYHWSNSISISLEHLCSQICHSDIIIFTK